METISLVRSTARFYPFLCTSKSISSTCKSLSSPRAECPSKGSPSLAGSPSRSSQSLEPVIVGGDFIRCGGLGTLLLSTTASVVSRARASPFIGDLAVNPTFLSGLVAWALAQTTKFILTFFVEKRWDLGILFSSGGMPSSHSALCTALSASVALCHGAGDALFPVCLGFSLIVMYDAIGVRRHAGIQAQVISLSSFYYLSSIEPIWAPAFGQSLAVIAERFGSLFL